MCFSSLVKMFQMSLLISRLRPVWKKKTGARKVAAQRACLGASCNESILAVININRKSKWLLNRSLSMFWCKKLQNKEALSWISCECFFVFAKILICIFWHLFSHLSSIWFFLYIWVYFIFVHSYCDFGNDYWSYWFEYSHPVCRARDEKTRGWVQIHK